MFRIFDKFRRRILELPTFRNRAASTEADQQKVQQSLLSDVLNNWPDGEPFRVATVLARYPELANSQAALVDLALEEFTRRKNDGEELTEMRFANQFPEFRSALLDSLLFENVLQENPWFEQALMPQAQNREVQWPLVGEVIAGFRLVEPLGSGGFSRVFVAEDMEFNNRRVALKICRSDTHEANTLAELQHVAIGAVHYVRSVPARGLTAICMPFCSRTTLHSVIRRSWLTAKAPQTARPAWEQVRKNNRLEREDAPWAKAEFSDWVLDLTIMLARALAASHEKDTIHCDLKPSNILISSDGLPILVDFNVAFRRSATASPCNVGGTLPYMAPEQIRAFAGNGFSDISGSTDIYGLGATIYELLTGKMPFGELTSADDGIRPLLELRRSGAAPIRQLNSNVDPKFAALLDACLSYEVSDRPASAELLADQLEKIRDRRRIRRPAIVTTIRAALITAAAAIVAAASFATTSEGPEPIQAAQSQVAPVPQVEDLVSNLLETGHDAFERGEFEAAFDCFKKATELDVEHEGAMLGQIRCCIHLGKTAAAQRLAQNWTTTRTPESAALQAYFSAMNDKWDVAADAFSRARASGVDTAAIRTNLAYALFMLNRDEESTDVIESLIQDFGDETGVSAILAAIYMKTQQGQEVAVKKALIAQKKRPVTDPTEFYDPVHLQTLVESAPEGPARGFIAGMVYPMFATAFKRVAPEVSRHMAGLAIIEFDRAVELGYDRAHWNAMKQVLNSAEPGYIETSDVAKKYEDVPAMALPPRVTSLFLCDPISGSKLDRWTGRFLSDADQDSAATLVARK